MNAARAPGSPWRSGEAAVPLLAWREAQLAAIGERVGRALRSWQEGWGLPPAAAQLHCAPARQDVQSMPWRLLGAAGAATAWSLERPGFSDALSEALLQERAATPLALALVESCRRGLLASLAGAIGLQPGTGEPGAPGDTGPWSGAVEIGVAGGLRVLVNAPAVAALLDRPGPGAVPPVPAAHAAPLTAVRDALAHSRLGLRVQLHDCDLPLRTLQDLQVGDVVRIRHALHDPLQVLDAQGHLLCAGYLVRRGAFKALELALPVAPAESTEKVFP